MPTLTEPMVMWRPGDEAVSDTGERTRVYERVVVRGKLLRGSGGVVENAEVALPDRSRQYLIRHRGDVSVEWYLHAGNDWFRVADVSPMVGPEYRRGGYDVITLTWSRDVPVVEEAA